MQAVIYENYGAPDVLHVTDVEKPTPKDDEVLIKIVATTVSAADWRMRKADPFLARLFNGLFKPRRVKILGLELAGVIEAVGAKVQKFQVGDAIFASPELRFGAYAEYTCLPENAAIAHKPATLSFAEAAAVPTGATTAKFFLDKATDTANDLQGKDVLIYGASGSVGTYAVQLARHYGATVTGVCSQKNREMVRSLGADSVLDYSANDFSLTENSYDVIFDTVGKSDFNACLKALKEDGRYLIGSSTSPLPALRGLWVGMRSQKKVITGTAEATSENLAFMAGLLEQGNLQVVIDRSYPLNAIVEAHRYVEQGHKRGNVVITVTDGY